MSSGEGWVGTEMWRREERERGGIFGFLERGGWEEGKIKIVKKKREGRDGRNE